MTVLTLRLPESLALQLKQAAAAQGRSLNAWATAVLHAAVDPDLASDEAARTRERLAAAGLLVVPTGALSGPLPTDEAVAAARAEAGRGKPLADYVSEGRG